MNTGRWVLPQNGRGGQVKFHPNKKRGGGMLAILKWCGEGGGRESFEVVLTRELEV